VPIGQQKKKEVTVTYAYSYHVLFCMELDTKFEVTFRPVDSTMNSEDSFDPLGLCLWGLNR